MILKQHRNIEFAFLYLFWITIFQTNTLFKTNKYHHGGPPWSGGPGAIAPVAPPLNPALFSGKSLRSFCRRQKAALLWRLTFAMGSLAKTVFNHYWTGFQSKCWRSNLQYLPSCILTYSSKRRDLTRKGNKDKIYNYPNFLWCRDIVTNKSKRYFFLDFYTLCLCWMHRFVSHMICLSLTKPTLQQCFRSSAKHLLYRYITPSFVGHSFRVEGETW